MKKKFLPANLVIDIILKIQFFNLGKFQNKPSRIKALLKNIYHYGSYYNNFIGQKNIKKLLTTLVLKTEKKTLIIYKANLFYLSNRLIYFDNL